MDRQKILTLKFNSKPTLYQQLGKSLPSTWLPLQPFDLLSNSQSRALKSRLLFVLAPPNRRITHIQATKQQEFYMGPAKRDNPERNVTKSNVPQQLIFTASLVLLLMYQKLNSNALCNTFSFSEIHWVPTLVISKPKLRASLSL